MAASSSEQHFGDVVSIEAVLHSEGGAVEVKLPKMESCRVGGPCTEHAANTKPNLPCFRQPSLTEEFIKNRTRVVVSFHSELENALHRGAMCVCV